MKNIIKGVIGILLILLVVILIVQNQEQLSKTLILNFFGAESPSMAFYLVIIIVFLFGVFIASFLGIIERFKLKREIRILSKESREKDKELNSFRNPPIVESKTEDKGLVEGDRD